MFFDIWNGVELTPSKNGENVLETVSTRMKMESLLNVVATNVIFLGIVLESLI